MIYFVLASSRVFPHDCTCDPLSDTADDRLASIVLFSLYCSLYYVISEQIHHPHGLPKQPDESNGVMP